MRYALTALLIVPLFSGLFEVQSKPPPKKYFYCSAVGKKDNTPSLIVSKVTQIRGEWAEEDVERDFKDYLKSEVPEFNSEFEPNCSLLDDRKELAKRAKDTIIAAKKRNFIIKVIRYAFPRIAWEGNTSQASPSN